MEYIENWLWREVADTSSTNDEARELSAELKNPCVVTALRQWAGRGRRGRTWISVEGNLFLSLAFRADERFMGQLVILSGLAVFNTVKVFCPEANVKVKWPNDVLVNQAKISGILFEKGADDFWITGVGINIVANPSTETTTYATTSLKSLGSKAARLEVLGEFLKQWNKLQETYVAKGFAPLKQTWLDNAFNLGKKIMIKQENEIKEGIFADLDNNGCLILQTKTGTEKIIVGDLFIKEEKNE